MKDKALELSLAAFFIKDNCGREGWMWKTVKENALT